MPRPLYQETAFLRAPWTKNARHQVPAADALGQASSKRRPPYIYTPDEIGQLLGAAAALPPADSIRPIMYATLLGLIAATGIRIAEALALQLDDVTADGLVIRESKLQATPVLLGQIADAGEALLMGGAA